MLRHTSKMMRPAAADKTVSGILENLGAPFDHEEEFPEPMDMEMMDHDEWDTEEKDDETDSEYNYDVTSMTSMEHEESVQGSPVFERSVFVEPASPPGIPVTFDDESWIV